MKKKAISIVAVIVIIGIVRFYPKEFIDIIGKEPNIGLGTNIAVIHRNNIFEGGTIVESSNQNHAQQILEYLKSHKYIKTNVSLRNFDNLEQYAITIEDSDKKVFKAVIRGERYASITDSKGRRYTYRVMGNTPNLETLRDFYNSLKQE